MFSFVIIVLLAIFIFLTYYYLKRPFNYWSKLGVRQTNPSIIFGDSWDRISKKLSFDQFVQRIYNTHSGVRYFGFYQFHSPTLLLKDPDLIKQITVKDFDHFTDHRSFVPEDADPLLGRNLFSLTGSKWRDMRSTLSPCFTSAKMKLIFILVNETSKNFTQYFKKLAKNSKNQNAEVELKDVFTRFTTDVIASTAFGVNVDSLADKENQFYRMGRRLTDFTGIVKILKVAGNFLFPKLLKLFKVKFLDDDLYKFFLNLISKTIRLREAHGIVRQDMIQLLLETRKNNQKQLHLSDLDIAAQAMVFFFAGFDSVSSLMSFMGYELAINPDIQTRLREEIREVLESENGELTYDLLQRMKYLDMVVSETLRKWPSFVAIDRVCTKPYTIKATDPEEQDLHLPVKSNIFLPIYGLHHDPEYFPNPEKFDPERFNEANKSQINPYTYLPFGLGPRNCIGSRLALMEAKTIFVHILNQFEIIPCAKSTIPVKIGTGSISITAEDGFWFELKKIGEEA